MAKTQDYSISQKTCNPNCLLLIFNDLLKVEIFLRYIKDKFEQALLIFQNCSQQTEIGNCFTLNSLFGKTGFGCIKSGNIFVVSHTS